LNGSIKGKVGVSEIREAPAPRWCNAHKGSSSYYAGKIATDHGDGTYDVDYDDGDAEQKVPADLIVRWSSSS